MKKLLGVIIVLLSISFIALLILRVWGISLVSWQNILRSGTTIALLGLLLAVLAVVYGLFFRNNRKGYNEKIGNRAHPKLDN